MENNIYLDKEKNNKVLRYIVIVLVIVLFVIPIALFIVIRYINFPYQIRSGVDYTIDQLRLTIKIIPDQVWPYPVNPVIKVNSINGNKSYYEYGVIDDVKYDASKKETKLTVKTLGAKIKTLIYLDSIGSYWFKGISSYMVGNTIDKPLTSYADEKKELFDFVSYDITTITRSLFIKYYWDKGRLNIDIIYPNRLVLIGRSSTYFR